MAQSSTSVDVFDVEAYRAKQRDQRLYPMHLPNVWAFSYTLPDSNAVVTLWVLTPGDCTPFMQLRYGCGSESGRVHVDNPEQFGSWDTLRHFQEWCTNFKDA